MEPGAGYGCSIAAGPLGVSALGRSGLLGPFSLSATQGSEVTPMKPSTISIALALSTVAALAEPLPVPKPPGPGGSCPFGYITSGSYCVPSQGAQDAIAKPPNGTCPWGWTSSS